MEREKPKEHALYFEEAAESVITIYRLENLKEEKIYGN